LFDAVNYFQVIGFHTYCGDDELNFDVFSCCP